jgi:hypothetical protein
MLGLEEICGLGSQLAVRGFMSLILGGSRTAQVLSELVLQSFALRFCSLEREGEKMKRETSPQCPGMAAMVPRAATWCLGLLCAIKK